MVDVHVADIEVHHLADTPFNFAPDGLVARQAGKRVGTARQVQTPFSNGGQQRADGYRAFVLAIGRDTDIVVARIGIARFQARCYWDLHQLIAVIML